MIDLAIQTAIGLGVILVGMSAIVLACWGCCVTMEWLGPRAPGWVSRTGQRLAALGDIAAVVGWVVFALVASWLIGGVFLGRIR